MARSGFTFDADKLSANIRNAPRKIDAAVATAFQYQARRSESFMRINAPWTDRTSNARNGLTAVASKNGDTHQIILAHSMPYGIWLEVRWSGKYGIIPEAVRAGGQEIMSLLNGLFAKLGSVS